MNNTRRTSSSVSMASLYIPIYVYVSISISISIYMYIYIYKEHLEVGNVLGQLVGQHGVIK